jgi:hypothetical protein
LAAQPGEKCITRTRLENYYELAQNECVDERPGTERQKTGGPSWSVWRQDDNGNLFMVRGGLTEQAALTLLRSLEREGHKQTYWVKEES